MKISYNRLKAIIAIDLAPHALGDLLTAGGLEVEGVEAYQSPRGGLEGVVIGEVTSCEPHPDADRLRVTRVDAGTGELLQIVCGAPNVAAGQRVAVAMIGAELYPAEGEPFKIKKSKIRGVESFGMLCAEDELGLGHSHEGIMVLSTELPNGTPLSQIIATENDHVFEIGLTPNRADAASHRGVARDLQAHLRRFMHYPIPALPTPGNKLPIHISVSATDACPVYAGLLVTGLQVAESPAWLKHYLLKIGVNPINNVVDITNYVLHDLGQPMHAFDYNKIAGSSINVRFAHTGETLVCLDGKERALKTNDLVIADSHRALCLAGVMGGLHTGVSADSHTVLLESAYFHPDFVRKTAQTHTLKTDSSFRFERGTDPEAVVSALHIAAQLLTELAGGRVASEIMLHEHQKPAPFVFPIRLSRVNDLIGKQMDKQEVLSILEHLEIKVKADTGDMLTLEVPAFKPDVTREADIVEEVLRIHGFDQIPVAEYTGADYLADTRADEQPRLIKNKLADMLAARGWVEIMTNSLVNEQYAQLPEADISGQPVFVLNKLSEETGVMRNGMLYTGLEALAFNINRRQKDLRLFEIAKVYEKTEAGYHEKNLLGLYVTGMTTAELWRGKQVKSDYFDLLETLQLLAAKFGIKIKQPEPVAAGLEVMTASGERLAKLHKVNSKTAKLFDIKQDVYVAVIDFDLLCGNVSRPTGVKEIPKFQEVRRDLSLILDKNIKFARIEQLARAANKQLIKEVSVFDVYEGNNIDAGKKSYSVKLVLQDEKATLTDEVIDRTMQQLMNSFEKELGALIRK